MRRDDIDRKGPKWWPWWLLRFPWILVPFPVAFIQLIGIRGAAMWAECGGGEHGWGPGREESPHCDWQDTSVDPVAFVLALIGPVALFAVRGFPRTVVAVCALITAVYYPLGLPPGPIYLSLIAALLAWLFKVRSERNAQAKAAQRAQAQQRAGAERLRIAQELHDVLAHHISLINVQSGVALHLVDEKPEQTRVALSAIKGASKEALTALRGALDALRSTDDAAPRSPTDGLAKLDALVDSVRNAGIEVDVTVTGQQRELDPVVDLAALRIIQESLTNVLRHSNARHVRIRIDHGDSLDITVADDGGGGVPIPGNGLTGMNERATAVGGTCTAGPAAAGGFAVHARLPGVG
ncbi:sensor histidine kinase [Stackebrandtia nassauensis]|uniref:histidine kinase n=1 Tax=Stackebrandtia nassauensis (strain DSM 44728 / CIP 108903 / NRRL B-16338 / NBRC 102104 / LLR-40K-21) TaxID=446470 RepID=D3Q9P0_STANL|nr:histidine kinase [Stackebrandtia nassauensis]ADD44586.1 histidine kinase [Stackebrandtia nassauensis DSM 44728]